MHAVTRKEQLSLGPFSVSDYPDLIPDSTVAFAACKAVPEILKEVGDSAKLELLYGKATKLENGMNLSPDAIADEPEVEISPEGTYTLMLVDADAPSPHAPKFRSWLLWLVTNIPSNDIKRGETVVEYMAPEPERGKHRLLYLLFKQNGRLKVHPPARRQNFQVEQWAKDHDLDPKPSNGIFIWCESNAAAKK